MEHTAGPEIPILEPPQIFTKPDGPFKLRLKLTLKAPWATDFLSLEQPRFAAQVDPGADRQDVGILRRSLCGKPVGNGLLIGAGWVRAGNEDNVQFSGLDFRVREVMGALDSNPRSQVNLFAWLHRTYVFFFRPRRDSR